MFVEHFHKKIHIEHPTFLKTIIRHKGFLFERIITALLYTTLVTFHFSLSKHPKQNEHYVGIQRFFI